ncbi:MAG: hypothetical protein ACRC3B_11690 [Bacteroidia bacterium]
MSKTKILAGVIVLLVLTNALLLYMLNSGGKKLPPPNARRMKVIEHLKFDENQASKYDVLIGEHRNAMEKNDQSILSLRTQLYRELNSVSPVVKDSLIAELGALQMRTEEIHFNHFKEIRKLCNPEQQKLFDDYSGELSKLFSKPRPPRKRD